VAVIVHGNASCQLEGQFLVANLCPHGIFVFCFDFAGCGCSGGEFVSLGWFERLDTEFLLKVLSQQFMMGPFILWGRSMGAATALLVKHPRLVGRVSDSSFTSIRDMCAAIASQMHLPHIFVPMALWYLKKKVLQAAKFRLESVSPITVNNGPAEVPAVFGHAEQDQFIPIEQCRRLMRTTNLPTNT
jgi:pimeloyl-ACP methyl ester carboxylesterase